MKFPLLGLLGKVAQSNQGTKLIHSTFLAEERLLSTSNSDSSQKDRVFERSVVERAWGGQLRRDRPSPSRGVAQEKKADRSWTKHLRRRQRGTWNQCRATSRYCTVIISVEKPTDPKVSSSGENTEPNVLGITTARGSVCCSPLTSRLFDTFDDPTCRISGTEWRVCARTDQNVSSRFLGCSPH